MTVVLIYYSKYLNIFQAKPLILLGFQGFIIFSLVTVIRKFTYDTEKLVRAGMKKKTARAIADYISGAMELKEAMEEMAI